MAKNKGKKNSGHFVALAYRHSITLRHGAGGRAVTTVSAHDSLNTWTRKSPRRINGQVVGPGVTVRTDNVETLRFEGDVSVVSDNR